MDGINATLLIRQWEQETHQPFLPIIALTAGAFVDDRQRCIAAGMNDFLTKPVNVSDLVSVFGKWMDANDWAEKSA
jgi:CheY-like chemotaxis protein